MRIFCALIATAFCLSPAIPARATLIDFGTSTRDTDQGIDWLDLTETAGLSVNAALAAFPGWALASGSQVCGFVAQAVTATVFQKCGGGAGHQFSGTTPPWGPLFHLWGQTITGGMGGPLIGNDESGTAGVFRAGDDWGLIDLWAVVSNSGSYRSSSASFETATPGIGVFLVRPIPEPGTGALLALGLAAIAHRRRALRCGFRSRELRRS